MTIQTALKVLVFAATGFGLAHAQGLNVKPGQWESTTTSTIGGANAPSVPPGVLDRLSPEQRARVEAQLKASGQPRTSVSKGCVTQEDVAKGFQPSNVLPQTCSYTLTTSTANQQKMAVTCETDKAKTTGTVQVDAVDSEHVKGTAVMTSAINGQTVNSTMTFTSKWVGPTCSEPKSAK